MTEDIKNKLPEILQKYICSIKKVSVDNSRNKPMTDSWLEVVNFDKIPSEYSRGKGWKCVPCSNDALYIAVDSEWYFIEFKNGSIDKADIYRKIYDSLIMMIELGVIPNIQFVRNNVNYILVYNSDKYLKVQESKSRNENYIYILNLAKSERRLFDVDKFEGYLFKGTHTYDEDEFRRLFIELMEKQENIEKSNT